MEGTFKTLSNITAQGCPIAGNHPRIKATNARIRGVNVRVFVRIRGWFAFPINPFTNFAL